MRVLRASRRSTRPSRWTTPTQRWFLNLVVEAETELFPMQLLHAHRARSSAIWAACARSCQRARAPSISISCFTATPWSRPRRLEIPHPRIAERRFVLAPLADLAPDLRHPVTRRTMREMLESGAAADGPPVTLLLHSGRPPRGPETLLGLRLIPPHAGADHPEPDGRRRRSPS